MRKRHLLGVALVLSAMAAPPLLAEEKLSGTVAGVRYSSVDKDNVVTIKLNVLETGYKFTATINVVHYTHSIHADTAVSEADIKALLGLWKKLELNSNGTSAERTLDGLLSWLITGGWEGAEPIHMESSEESSDGDVPWPSQP